MIHTAHGGTEFIESTEVFLPNWQDFGELVRHAEEELFLCSPFYSSAGIDRLFDYLEGRPAISFWTRVSAIEWARHVSDPESLLALGELLGDVDIPFRMRVHGRLHAKVFVADRNRALVGSANLSDGGFGGNLELVTRLKGGLAAAAQERLESAVSPRDLTVSGLASWVSEYRPTILEARSRITDAPEDLAPAQRALDEMLGSPSSGNGGPLPNPGRDDLIRFVRWLRGHVELPGAATVLERSDNSDGQNLTGHVKQCFCATVRFLAEYPTLVEPLSSELDRLGDRIYQLDSSQVLECWLRHIDEHVTDQDDERYWDYVVLRNLLPPGLGGTVSTGGGGSSTLKRLLPLVARYLASDSIGGVSD